VAGRASSWGITSGSSRARFNPLDDRVTAGSTTTVPSVETEDAGGREPEIELTLSLLKMGTDLRCMHKHHCNEAVMQMAYLVQSDLCSSQLVRLNSPSPSSWTVIPQNPHSIDRGENDLT
jgi:hypothetical protein